ncbi:Transcription factor bHLH111 [Zea mays]|uniref:Transcription factor bHLH111 n=1 Tax=Zea mays TaxID=4577 RepID=A0A3L6FXR7_MAIZE|nr:Transcription factor bHLH111 [Zea mays]
MHDAHDDSENFLELLNSRTLVPELFADPPACDYLKKMEYGSSHGGGGWPDHHQFTTAAALEKHLSSGYGGGALAHQHQHAAAGGAPERLTANLSDLVSNWSIAPPNPCLGDAHHHHRTGVVAAACDNDNAKAGMFLGSGGGVCKHEIGGHGAMLEGAATGGTGGDQEFLRPAAGYSSMLGLSRNNRTMYMEAPWGSNAAGATRSLSDLISFGGAPLGKAEEPAPPTSTKAQAEYKKQGHDIPSPAKTSSGGGSKGIPEGKKKRSEQQQGSSEGNTKKSKSEVSSPTSSLKASSQVPKVKLGDKITALQQIVSPFGKTDTASVLYEAINYIKWLHEQVQLLSDPYMKTSSKDYNYNAWGRLEDKEGAEMVDLRSRGLCLVPVSCTPQAYRDSNDGPDYWTPPYRSCLYR